MSRPPLPPFTAETAAQKARMAEDAWNSRDPSRVVLAYTENSRWRNRNEFLEGRPAIEAFLQRKWQRELDYRLIKEVWAFRENRIAVRFAYEWHDDGGQWFRSYGNENWEFDAQGLMAVRIASINDLLITEADRKYHWPLGRRPDDHASLSELGALKSTVALPRFRPTRAVRSFVQGRTAARESRQGAALLPRLPYIRVRRGAPTTKPPAPCWNPCAQWSQVVMAKLEFARPHRRGSAGSL